MARSKVSKTGSKPHLKKGNPAAASGDHTAASNGQAQMPAVSMTGLEKGLIPEINGKPMAPPGLVPNPASLPSAATHAAELAEKVKELVRLAQEQGYLT